MGLYGQIALQRMRLAERNNDPLTYAYYAAIARADGVLPLSQQPQPVLTPNIQVGVPVMQGGDNFFNPVFQIKDFGGAAAEFYFGEAELTAQTLSGYRRRCLFIDVSGRLTPGGGEPENLVFAAVYRVQLIRAMKEVIAFNMSVSNGVDFVYPEPTFPNGFGYFPTAEYQVTIPSWADGTMDIANRNVTPSEFIAEYDTVRVTTREFELGAGNIADVHGRLGIFCFDGN